MEILNEENLDKITSEVLNEIKKIADSKKVNELLNHCEALENVLHDYLNVNEKLSKALAYSFDVGRTRQYNVLQKYDDKIKHHQDFALEFFDDAVKEGKLNDTLELRLIKNCIYYHRKLGNVEQGLLTNEEIDMSKKLVIASDIENGCIGAVGYLEKEKEEDLKGYIKNNPNLNQKEVSKEVLEYYMKGEKFNKNIYCKTYADYFLFAALLAIDVLKKDDFHDAAKEAMENISVGKYKNAIDGYRNIFENHIDSSINKKCFEILNGYIYKTINK